MIHWRTLIHVLSFIVMIVSGFLLFPAVVGLFYGEYTDSLLFLAIAVSSAAVMTTVFFITKRKKPFHFSNRDGFLLVTLSWICVSAIGALPFMLSGAIPSFSNAFFETMSGFTTTGASILTEIEKLSHAILFWRSLTHWLGGMGIVVLAVAVLPLIGIGGMPLIQAESPGPRVDKIVPKVRETAMILWLIYLGLTVLETVLLLFGGMSLFDALTHTFGTMATGGFSVKNASVGYYQSAYLQNVITIFMILAGVNFGLYFVLLRKDIKTIARNSEFKLYILIFVLAMLVIAFDLFRNTAFNAEESLRYAGFQAASILTTTGFATDNFDTWPALSKSVLFVLMFIGGCSGSTGGGIKVIRILALFKLGFHEMRQLLNPRGVYRMRMNQKIIHQDMMYTVTGFVFLYVLILIFVTLAVSVSGSSLITSFSAALVTVGYIGPGFDQIGPVMNYGSFPDWLKWILSMAMLIGRLEVYTVLIIFTPSFWKK